LCSHARKITKYLPGVKNLAQRKKSAQEFAKLLGSKREEKIGRDLGHMLTKICDGSDEVVAEPDAKRARTEAAVETDPAMAAA
jgi:hypothetical protein